MEYFRDTVIIRTPGTDVKKNMSESIISPDGNHYPYLLAFSDVGHYIMIGSKEAYVWSCLYRPQTIGTLTEMFFKKYGIFGKEFIVDLMQKWADQGYVSINGVPKFRNRFKFKVSFEHFDRILKPLYSYIGKPLLIQNRWIALVSLALFCLLIRAVNRPGTVTVDYSSPLEKVLFLISAALILGTLHEIAHGLVAIKYGVNVKRAGFKFIYGVPFFFVDLSESWIRPRKERIGITLAGPLFNITLAGLLCIPLLLRIAPELTQLIREVIWLNILTVVINLLPFHGLDGYFILEDIVGVPDLNKRAWRAALGKDKRNRLLLTIYAFTSILISILLLIFTYRTWIQLFGALA